MTPDTDDAECFNAMTKYYGYRFQKPDENASAGTAFLKDFVAGAGILIGIPFVILSEAVTRLRGDLNAADALYIGSIIYFFLMAKFADEWPRAARGLIAVPATLVTVVLAITLTVTYESVKPTQLTAGILMMIYFALVALVSGHQLRKLGGRKEDQSL